MADVLLRFIHISDTHFAALDYQHPPTRIKTREGSQALIDHINAQPFMPDFILHTGDVAYDPDPAVYADIKDMFSALKVPVRYLPGNHDHSPTLQTVLMERDTVMTPLYHTEVMNGVRIIYLDSNSPAAKPPAGHVTDEQLDWLREQLAQDDPRPIVVTIHHPLLKTHTSEWYDVFMMTINGDAVHEVLATAADRIRGVFYGHVHQDMTFIRDGITYSSTVSSWTQFFTLPDQTMQTANDLVSDPGYSLVTVTTEGTFIQRYRYRMN